LGYKVILTRNSDVFIPLQERTDIANDNKADIFISIHANASERKDASGIETYYLDFAKSDRALETAARENKVPRSNIQDDVQYILADMVANTKMNESSQLAGIVQNNLIQGMRKKFKRVKDLRAKGGPFYVLHGASMPSVLVETSFISNPIEGKRLGSSKYREKLAYFILEGIEKYFREIQVALKTK
jgi:N-acetylmuramoyl-L-alanine amidase